MVDSITQTGALSSNYITKSQARAMGWSEGKALNNYAPGKALSGAVFANTNGVLPSGWAVIDAVNQALNSGANVTDLYLYTINTKNNVSKPMCENYIYVC